MRSILADPRSPSARRTLNQCVKQREMFRPFARAVPVEHASEWFDLDGESPYMGMTTSVSLSRRTVGAPHPTLEAPDRDASHTVIPAVSHVDYSARVQTVDRRTHPRFWALLNAFGDRTGCPVLVNTSFNVRGEPIVCSPEDAFSCFMRTGLDALVVGDCYLTKVEQPPGFQRDEPAFDPD